MTSPIKGNFGHIRESGVLLLTKEDSNLKHKRNAKLAGLTFAAVFSMGAACMFLEEEVDREKEIRSLGRKFPMLPYSKCVEMEKKCVVDYKGHRYAAASFHTQEQKDRIEEQWTKVVQDNRDPEEVFDPYPHNSMAWGGGYL